MKEYLVSLDVVSSTLSLEELSAAIGAPPGSASHSVGDSRPVRRRWAHSIWRLPSEAGDGASLADHCRWLRERAAALGLLRDGALPAGVRRYLNVAVMTDRVTCTVEMLPEDALPFVSAGVALEITVYPTAQEAAAC